MKVEVGDRLMIFMCLTIPIPYLLRQVANNEQMLTMKNTETGLNPGFCRIFQYQHSAW